MDTMGKSFPGQAGFTLIEMLTAIAMISILAAVATVSLRNYFPNAELRSATRNLVALTQRGRAEATTRGVNCVINFNAPLGGMNQVAILFADADGNNQFSAGDTLITTIAPGTYTYVGVASNFANNGAGQPTVIFLPRGRVATVNNALGGTITLTNTDDGVTTRQITMNVAGSVTVS